MTVMYTDSSGMRVIQYPETVMCGIAYEFPTIKYGKFSLCRDEDGWYFDGGNQDTISLGEAVRDSNLTEEEAVYLKLKYGD